MSLETNGYDILSPGLADEELMALRHEFPPDSPNRRNLFLFSPLVETLVRKGSFSAAAQQALGPNAFAVRAIFFNKIEKANWHVPFHQDISVPVKARKDVAGFSAYSTKEGVLHANAPAEVLERMIILRLHLDAATVSNGAMKLIPGSHLNGRLSDPVEGHHQPVQPETMAGEILRLRPLLFHASAHSKSDTPRRVVHIEYAAHDLPGGLEWAARVNPL
ncbi:MAG: phytanoyl-CoA dioxygenase family protein [Acidobacteria bacterium]|nr:phytanoyl-CoA dioxygenase family protein [Acidobacteriota bacterium]